MNKSETTTCHRPAFTDLRTRALRFATACALSLPLLAFSICISGCVNSVGTVTPPENKVEMIATKELPALLKTTPQPSIAMRYQLNEQMVMNAEGSSVTRSSGFASAFGFGGSAFAGSSANSRESSQARAVAEKRLSASDQTKLQFIKLLEKELMKAGFTLHDLTLQDPAATTKGRADLIIELRNLEFAGRAELQEYTKHSNKGDYIGNLSKDGYKCSVGYNRFEGQIVLSGSGVVGTMFDLVQFGAIPNPVKFGVPEGTYWSDKEKIFPPPTLEESAAWMAKKIMDFLSTQKDAKF